MTYYPEINCILWIIAPPIIGAILNKENRITGAAVGLLIGLILYILICTFNMGF